MAGISTSALLISIIVPVAVILVIIVSIYVYYRRRARARGHSIREITSPIIPRDKERKAFYDFRPTSFGAGYESVAPLSPIYNDQDSPRSTTFRGPWRHSHSREFSLDSDASGSSTLAGTLPVSPTSDGRASPWLGKYATLLHSGRSTPLLGSPRSKKPASGPNISLPKNNVQGRIPTAPMAWQADVIVSDGSDRTTPSPLAPLDPYTPRIPFQDVPCLDHRDAVTFSPYNEPERASAHMSDPIMLATPPAPKSRHDSSVSSSEQITTDMSRDMAVLPTTVEEPEPSSSHTRSRSQTMTTVTTIRSSFESIRADWQEEEMPQMPQLQRSMYSVEEQRRRDRQRRDSR